MDWKFILGILFLAAVLDAMPINNAKEEASSTVVKSRQKRQLRNDPLDSDEDSDEDDGDGVQPGNALNVFSSILGSTNQILGSFASQRQISERQQSSAAQVENILSSLGRGTNNNNNNNNQLNQQALQQQQLTLALSNLLQDTQSNLNTNNNNNLNFFPSTSTFGVGNPFLSTGTGGNQGGLIPQNPFATLAQQSDDPVVSVVGGLTSGLLGGLTVLEDSEVTDDETLSSATAMLLGILGMVDNVMQLAGVDFGNN